MKFVKVNILTFVIKQTKRKADVTRMKGKRTFNIINDIIKNGENTVTKERIQAMSKEFKDARFPIPKNDSMM